MDPVSLAIISGILGGAAGGVAGEATGEVVSAYKKFRGMLIEKYGEKSILLRSIGTLEQKPESKNKQEGVAEDVVDCGADKEPEFLAAAERLLKLVQPQYDNRAINTGSGAIVQGNGNAGAGQGGVAIVGNVTGGINTPGNRDEEEEE